jgi:hypothetical protein
VRLGPPFIAGGEVLANYPTISYKCGILTYTVAIPLCRVTRVPALGLGNHHYTVLCLVNFVRGEECTWLQSTPLIPTSCPTYRVWDTAG